MAERGRKIPKTNATTGASTLKIGVIGCAGRMGQMLVRAVAAAEGCVVSGGTERSGAAAIGQDVGLVAGDVGRAHCAMQVDQDLRISLLKLDQPRGERGGLLCVGAILDRAVADQHDSVRIGRGVGIGP